MLWCVAYSFECVVQMEVVLDETHKRFMSDTSKVKQAQQGLARAWEDLYFKLTTTYSNDEQGVSGTVHHITSSTVYSVIVCFTEAKAATAVAYTELKEAAREYDISSQKLKELLQRAPAEGFMAKAGDIAGDMRVKEAEVDLGMVVVKEAVTSASVAEGYREAIQESKDKLQK